MIRRCHLDVLQGARGRVNSLAGGLATLVGGRAVRILCRAAAAATVILSAAAVSGFSIVGQAIELVSRNAAGAPVVDPSGRTAVGERAVVVGGR